MTKVVAIAEAKSEYKANRHDVKSKEVMIRSLRDCLTLFPGLSYVIAPVNVFPVVNQIHDLFKPARAVQNHVQDQRFRIGTGIIWIIIKAIKTNAHRSLGRKATLFLFTVSGFSYLNPQLRGAKVDNYYFKVLIVRSFVFSEADWPHRIMS